MPKKGYKQTEEHKQKIREALLGKPKTEEHRRKNREAHLGVPLSEETKQKMKNNRVGMKGKHHTEESKQKNREANIGLQVGEKNGHWNGGRAAAEERRRGLGFIPINDKFDGTDAHHIDRDFVIYIPRELHNSIYHNMHTGQGMKEMNNAAFEYTYKEDRI